MLKKEPVLFLCNMKYVSRLIVFSLLGFWYCQNAGAQTNQTLRSQAYYASEDKDWFAAAQYYARLYARDTSDIKLQSKYADASRLNFDLDLALSLYLHVAALDNGKQYPLTFYWIGELLKYKQQYKEAKKWFSKFNKLKLRREKYNYYKQKTIIQMQSCDLAQILMNNPLNLEAEHLDELINSKLSEYAAFERDSSLYFSSLQIPEKRYTKNSDNEGADKKTIYFSKIYKADYRMGSWKKIKALDTLFNANQYHTANTSFSSDYKQMIISRCRAVNASEYTCDLYVSNYMNNHWTEAIPLEAPINQPSVSTTQGNFAELDGKPVLFFSSDRPGGEGGLDIWCSYKNADGSFAPPINAGKKVNTPDNDITPWFVNETKALYFSSTWHQGLGGYDIFKSQYSNHEFSDPENVGYPINSSFNDVYYTVNKNGKRIYLSSNREGSFFESKLNCCNDIYRFNLDTAKPVIVVDTTHIIKEQLKLLVPLTLYFHNDEPDSKRLTTSTTKNYESTYNDYKAMMPQYVKQYTTGLKGDNKELATNRIGNFFTDSLDEGFDDLKQFSVMLKKIMLNGETVKITMKGYCSPLASNEYNTNLAKRRISSLRNYFMEYENAWFLNYVSNETGNGGKIIFAEEDIGELPISRASDNVKDIQNSVFSPYAASERKIQIIAISFGK